MQYGQDIQMSRKKSTGRKQEISIISNDQIEILHHYDLENGKILNSGNFVGRLTHRTHNDRQKAHKVGTLEPT